MIRIAISAADLGVSVMNDGVLVLSDPAGNIIRIDHARPAEVANAATGLRHLVRNAQLAHRRGDRDG